MNILTNETHYAVENINEFVHDEFGRMIRLPDYSIAPQKKDTSIFVRKLGLEIYYRPEADCYAICSHTDLFLLNDTLTVELSELSLEEALEIREKFMNDYDFVCKISAIKRCNCGSNEDAFQYSSPFNASAFTEFNRKKSIQSTIDSLLQSGYCLISDQVILDGYTEKRHVVLEYMSMSDECYNCEELPF